MDQEQEPIPDNATADAPSGAWKSIGQEFRAARERKGKHLDDVGRAIKIRPDHLAAIEEGRFEDLPSRALVIGYMGRYGRYLGLDGEKLPKWLEAEIGSEIGPGIDIEPVSDRKFRPVGTVLAGLWLGALIIIAYGIGLYAVLYLIALILS